MSCQALLCRTSSSAAATDFGVAASSAGLGDDDVPATLLSSSFDKPSKSIKKIDLEHLLTAKILDGYVPTEVICPQCDAPLLKLPGESSGELNAAESNPYVELKLAELTSKLFDQAIEVSIEAGPTGDGSDMDDDNEPVRDVLYCVSCKAHIVTNVTEIERLAKGGLMTGAVENGTVIVASLATDDDADVVLSVDDDDDDVDGQNTAPPVIQASTPGKDIEAVGHLIDLVEASRNNGVDDEEEKDGGGRNELQVEPPEEEAYCLEEDPTFTAAVAAIEGDVNKTLAELDALVQAISTGGGINIEGDINQTLAKIDSIVAAIVPDVGDFNTEEDAGVFVECLDSVIIDQNIMVPTSDSEEEKEVEKDEAAIDHKGKDEILLSKEPTDTNTRGESESVYSARPIDDDLLKNSEQEEVVAGSNTSDGEEERDETMTTNKNEDDTDANQEEVAAGSNTSDGEEEKEEERDETMTTANKNEDDADANQEEVVAGSDTSDGEEEKGEESDETMTANKNEDDTDAELEEVVAGSDTSAEEKKEAEKEEMMTANKHEDDADAEQEEVVVGSDTSDGVEEREEERDETVMANKNKDDADTEQEEVVAGSDTSAEEKKEEGKDETMLADENKDNADTEQEEVVAGSDTSAEEKSEAEKEEAATANKNDEIILIEALGKESSTRRKIAYKVLEAKMLQGFVLKDELCLMCGMPFMEDNKGKVNCEVCPVLERKAKKAQKKANLGANSLNMEAKPSPSKLTKKNAHKAEVASSISDKKTPTKYIASEEINGSSTSSDIPHQDKTRLAEVANCISVTKSDERSVTKPTALSGEAKTIVSTTTPKSNGSKISTKQQDTKSDGRKKVDYQSPSNKLEKTANKSKGAIKTQKTAKSKSKAKKSNKDFSNTSASKGIKASASKLLKSKSARMSSSVKSETAENNSSKTPESKKRSTSKKSTKKSRMSKADGSTKQEKTNHRSRMGTNRAKNPSSKPRGSPPSAVADPDALDDMSVLTEVSQSSRSAAVDSLLHNIDDAKMQLAISNGHGSRRAIKEQLETAKYLESLASAAFALIELDEL